MFGVCSPFPITHYPFPSPQSPVPIPPYPQRGPRVPHSPFPLIPRGGPEFPIPMSNLLRMTSMAENCCNKASFAQQ
ncbi:hypothetical protein FDUTEX481_00204 [Tolypothrix sp. PCC 7601]|nr:hypothetical protein FDUTEX481_00204 [Tolypothrix sp. PCC 7601]